MRHIGSSPSGGFVIDRSVEEFQRIIDETPPEIKDFAQSLKGLPKEERDRRIKEWVDSLPDDDDD